MLKIKPVVHYCGYASQPYADIYCTGYSHYVIDDTDIPEVYAAEDFNKDGKHDKHDKHVLYTFDWKNVTCEDCLVKKVS